MLGQVSWIKKNIAAICNMYHRILPNMMDQAMVMGCKQPFGIKQGSILFLT